MRRELIIILAAVLANAGVAAAHGGGSTNRHPVLGPLPVALAGMRIEVHETLSPQLVIENPTTHTVEVLDDAGVPFLRIGPQGVEGNTAARAWYLTFSPGAAVPAAADGREPRWVRVSHDPSFGWFDLRLQAPHVKTSHDTGATEVGDWQVPLRVDASPVTLTGQFHSEPRATGTFTSRLTSPSEIAQGVRVTLLPGHVPGLLVHNTSARSLVIFGESGEPFVRIGPGGVEANLRSSTWWQTRRSSGHHIQTPDPGAAPEWQPVSLVPRFSWIEPRAAGEAAHWQIPIQLGDERLQVSGVTAWRQFDHPR